jgi:hypothetical protein
MLLVLKIHYIYLTLDSSEEGVRPAQQMQDLASPCIAVGMQLYEAGVGPTSGPTWRLLTSPARRRLDHARVRISVGKECAPDSPGQDSLS